MAFFTYSELKAIEEMIITEGFTGETIIEAASDTTEGKNIFLAHSPLDEEYIVGAISFFFGFNSNVYIKKTSKKKTTKSIHTIASDFKSIIKSCPKIVTLVSPESCDSEWIPWKLGYAEGIKGWESVAIFPIKSEYDVEDWADQSYLSIYPRIVHEFGDWVVKDPRDGNHWKLYRWLTM